ncbi:hypothetical protein EYF80_061800 [Liparis tanakae]|uniref:Uncharacterized protein n=1 Tax=Liparis tanakae TaxID=230148 RepID=A0A4Z2EI74_9TELE|nr:hypothetical protein EYF80_061800 [Liparis tanakae]
MEGCGLVQRQAAIVKHRADLCPNQLCCSRTRRARKQN